MPGVEHRRIHPDEAGQKLVAWLRRAVGRDVPQSAIMRWIRTGQVRVDGGRAKPFTRLRAGQTVRIPPRQEAEPQKAGPEDAGPRKAGPAQPGREVHIVHREPGLVVAAKPPGLPVHGGTGHADSLVARLARAMDETPFPPTPAHRLDKDTSGLVLVATSHDALRRLTALFRDHAVAKEYLTWVAGAWPYREEARLEDELRKQADQAGGRERVLAGHGRRAVSLAKPLTRPGEGPEGATLLLVRLVTGRTHQIRVQLAERDHPVVGDRKYGAGREDPAAPGLKLHAWRLGLEGRTFTLPPPWQDRWAVRREWLDRAGRQGDE